MALKPAMRRWGEDTFVTGLGTPAPRTAAMRRLTPVLLLTLLLSVAFCHLTALAQQTATPAATGYRGSGQESPYTGSFQELIHAIDGFWVETFRAASAPYGSPAVVPLDTALETGCGPRSPGDAALYCPVDGTIYLNPWFLESKRQDVGDYAPITVLAHEWGHHVQALTNTPYTSGNQFELQADCLAGVYTQYAEEHGLLDPGDISEAVSISGESGDPLGLPQDQPGAHGINDDRIKAFMRGYLDGLAACGLVLPAGPAVPRPAAVPSEPGPQAPSTLPLPSALPLAHAACFRIEDDGELTFDQLVARLGGSDEARDHLQNWGWQTSAYRVFACDEPPEGEAGWVEISVHQFADAASAQQALDYFAAQRAEGAPLMTGTPPALGDRASVLSGPASNGKEFTLYVSQGPFLIRVTAVSPSGIPFADVMTVAQSILNTGLVASPPEAVPPPSAPAVPASVYLPAAPAVTYAECFRVLDQGTYSPADVVDALEQTGLNQAQIDALGWQDGAYVVFTCPDPPYGRASHIEVVIHQFEDAAAAEQALPYLDSTYVPGSQEMRSCEAGGPLVICVTGRSLTGSPLSDVAFVLQQVVATAPRFAATAPPPDVVPTATPVIRSGAASQGTGDMLTTMLPAVSEVPAGLMRTAEGSRSAEEIAATFPDPADAAQRFPRWGWQESVYRDFASPDGTTSVSVSLHRFADPQSAADAVPYLAEARAGALGLDPIPVADIGDQVAAVAGEVAGGQEVSLYVQQGAVVARVTVVTAAGEPLAIARETASAMLRK